jgi:hypothetical protein
VKAYQAFTPLPRGDLFRFASAGQASSSLLIYLFVTWYDNLSQLLNEIYL